TLLAEFFHVFGDYDFAGHVISLQEGQLLPMPSVLKSEVGSKLKLGPFNLQDPFELSHNVAANVNEKTAQRFQRCCQVAAKYCRSLQYQRKSSKGKIWGLVRLFQLGTAEAEVLAATGFVINFPLTLAALPAESRKLLCQAGDFHQQWFRKVCASITFVLRDVLKCSCLEVQEGLEQEQQPAVTECKQGEQQTEVRAEQPMAGRKRSLDEEEAAGSSSPSPKRPRTDTLLPEGQSMTWNCAVWHKVWLGRRRVRRQLRGPQPDPQHAAGSLEMEAKVSEAISQQAGEARPTDPLFQFTVHAQAGASASGERDTRLSLCFEPAPEQAAAFQEFFHFLQGFLPRAVEQQLASEA
ncbi:PREDICTED: speckle targeted PIP5K1A-regulated poly(A) polymerase-like, partial [Gekko japonicus]|uniref:Speckle targeted PIP5K1A-regulated poly(A) polymerase-like n=1 Tax=Gekko japonicus TaxID=146911 RepID=A0ABM1LDR0_GEKJA